MYLPLILLQLGDIRSDLKIRESESIIYFGDSRNFLELKINGNRKKLLMNNKSYYETRQDKIERDKSSRNGTIGITGYCIFRIDDEKSIKNAEINKIYQSQNGEIFKVLSTDNQIEKICLKKAPSSRLFGSIT
jgi:hypothetical protein